MYFQNEMLYRLYRNKKNGDDTPTPSHASRSYSDQVSKEKERDRGHHRSHYERKGIYASTNKPSGSSQKDRDRHGRKHDWDEVTPSHKQHGDSHFHTPSSKLKDTPSRSGWEEDEHHGNRKKSNWDLNTPKTQPGRNRDDQSR